MKMKLSLISAAMLSASLLITPAVSMAKMPIAVNGQQLPTLAPMLEQITPGVVSIQVSGSKEIRRRADPLDFFFGNPQPRSQKREFSGLGSGVIIDAKEGYVVTNNHVVQDAEKMLVTLEDGREYEATKIGSDKESDIALLKIDAEDLVAVKLANSDQLRVGDFAVAIGNPFGLSHTVTSGIVSALGRSGLNIEGYEDFIQTDAAINQGNSGGALVNLNGELIGINTAILGASGGNVGIGFAIPSNMMKNLVDQIIEHGEVRRGSLGISGRPLDAGLAKAQQLDVKQGAYVMQVMDDSAASEAGIKAGDVIISIDGSEISGFHELRSKIATLGEGKKVKLGIYRDGKVQTVKVTLDGAAALTAAGDELHPAFQGATLENTQKNGNKGVEVTTVDPRSPAARVGLEEGDVVMQVNRQRVETISDMNKIIENTKGNIVLGVQRGRESVFVLIQ
ncbi:Do family serine endopeptidase [Pseudoalteromonas arctica]|uniref:Do family serine endopeptidase n=1 Tax=Pseudoalteromonas arctica TaxID=394751 RepID=A0A7Y0DUP4_9GAMM|nr:Do family serine endopeptidase [Pseudoalteromonas arctica]NMM41936.1 Do family serine endopeptidase [Pseudoalteromonas arctica]